MKDLDIKSLTLGLLTASIIMSLGLVIVLTSTKEEETKGSEAGTYAPAGESQILDTRNGTMYFRAEHPSSGLGEYWREVVPHVGIPEPMDATE